MKITEIQIERFGVWRNLSLPLASSGLNVVYGANEAGKTTLMRFIRSVLYGFEPFGSENDGRCGAEPPAAGALKIVHEGNGFQVRRVANRGSRGLVSVAGLDGSEPPDQLLARMLGSTDERIYERVFAVGLQEIQELATLNDSDVARHIYGVSLGPEGQKLLDALSAIELDLRRLFDPDSQGGELVDLLLRYEELLQEYDELKLLRARHRELRREHRSLQETIADVKNRQAGIESQLRGHQFLERVWEPWNQVRSYKRELEKLPVVSSFPEKGLQRLDRLDEQIGSLETRRQQMLDEARDLGQQAEALRSQCAPLNHAPAMQGFIDQQQWAADTAAKRDALDGRVEQLEKTVAEKIAALGPEWSADRLHKVDTSVEAHRRITQSARNYQTSRRRRGWLRHRYRRLASACHRRLATLNDDLKSLGDESLEQAVQSTREQLRGLEELSELQLREQDLERRIEGINDQLSLIDGRLSLPRWVHWVLVFFAVGGALAALFGLLNGAIGNAIAGIMWALLGTTCGLVAWAVKAHFEGAAADCIERLADESRDCQVKLRETRQAIERRSSHLARDRAPGAVADGDAVSHGSKRSPAEPIRQTVHRLAMLEGRLETQQRLQARRRLLSELRGRLQKLQREASAARQRWCQTLLELGLTETVRIGDALDEWQKVVEAGEVAKQCELARQERQIHREALESFRRRLAQLGKRIDRRELDFSDPAAVLARWQEELEQLGQSRAEFSRLRREGKARRREAAALRSQIEEHKTERAALLVQGGASSREEFQQRAELFSQRQELEELLILANAELDSAARTEPELAIVEDDLLVYNAEEIRKRIDVLQLEYEELETELQQAFESLGRTKQTIKDLESDCRSTQLRREISQLEECVKRAAEDWLGLNLAARCVEQMKHRHERTRQPATLAAAGSYLEQLTSGRYRNVWTPLGERQLCVDDERGQSLRVERLSNGTREQLFLAIRLALVSRFAAEGIELPVVLDDVIVNFDQLRTEAAVDTLMRFAASEGQQILLFTCHLHLAHLFESRGIEPIWLPGHNPPIQERAAG